MSIFSNNLTYVKNQSQLADDEFANAFEISTNTLRQLESGSVDPGIGLLISISRIYHCSIDELILENLEGRQAQASPFSCRMLALDVDGVLTDGGMYYTEGGDEFKRFNTKDGMAIKFLVKNGIPVAFISSGFNRNIIENRAKLLGISHVYVGSGSKLPVLKAWCEQLGIGLNQVAYVGDDVNDLEIMHEVGLSACPADAVDAMKKVAGLILEHRGGEGCVREFVDKYIMEVRGE